MIFVTVGNARQSFGRLIDAIVELHEASRLDDDDVLIQHGHTSMPASLRIHAVPFMGNAEFENNLRTADVIVCHGGCGTLLACARYGKVPVVVPRRKRYREHVNEHQLELALELERQKKVIVCDDLSTLAESIKKARMTAPQTRIVDAALPGLVRQAIRDLINRRAY